MTTKSELSRLAEEMALTIGTISTNDQKIMAIKAMRETYGSLGSNLGLKEAKDFVERLMNLAYTARYNLILAELHSLRVEHRDNVIRTPKVFKTTGADLRDFNGVMIAQCVIREDTLTIADGYGTTSVSFPAADLDGIIDMLQALLPVVAMA